ncbi:hypothetical protein ACLKA7_016545 [Drosophila subpalustris]
MGLREGQGNPKSCNYSTLVCLLSPGYNVCVLVRVLVEAIQIPLALVQPLCSRPSTVGSLDSKSLLLPLWCLLCGYFEATSCNFYIYEKPEDNVQCGTGFGCDVM